MADDNTQRYRANDPYGRGTPDPYGRGPGTSGGRGSGNDPLAELARLIGQSDPFAEFGRDARRAPQDQHPTRDDWHGGGQDGYGQPASDRQQAYPGDETYYGDPQSRDNPVFYVQYGHARGCSVFRNAVEVAPDLPGDPGARFEFFARAPLDRLEEPAERALMRKIALYPRLLEGAATAHEPHRIAFYLYELASEFHAFWTRGKDLPHLRFIIQNDPQMTAARLALVQGVVTVLASGLHLLGVEAPREMR